MSQLCFAEKYVALYSQIVQNWIKGLLQDRYFTRTIYVAQLSRMVWDPFDIFIRDRMKG